MLLLTPQLRSKLRFRAFSLFLTVFIRAIAVVMDVVLTLKRLSVSDRLHGATSRRLPS
jgi:hypothetical protein